MRTWEGLFQRLEELDPLERKAQTERAEFERWAAAAEPRVMADLLAAARTKCGEIRSRTGISVDVVQASGKALASFGGAGRLVSLAVAGCSVNLYTTRSRGESPSVHLACARAPTTSRFPVVMTLPGCFAIRSGASDYRLLALPERTPTTVDDVMLRAFGILFGALESVVRSSPTNIPARPPPP